MCSRTSSVNRIGVGGVTGQSTIISGLVGRSEDPVSGHRLSGSCKYRFPEKSPPALGATHGGGCRTPSSSVGASPICNLLGFLGWRVAAPFTEVTKAAGFIISGVFPLVGQLSISHQLSLMIMLKLCCHYTFVFISSKPFSCSRSLLLKPDRHANAGSRSGELHTTAYKVPGERRLCGPSPPSVAQPFSHRKTIREGQPQ